MMARNPHGKKAYSCLARSSEKLASNRLLRCSTARQQGRRGPGGSAEPLLRPDLDHTTGSRHLAAAPMPARTTSQEAPQLCFAFAFQMHIHPRPANPSQSGAWVGQVFRSGWPPFSPREGEHPSSPSTAPGCTSSQRARAEGGRAGQRLQRGKGILLCTFCSLFFFFSP